MAAVDDALRVSEPDVVQKNDRLWRVGIDGAREGVAREAADDARGEHANAEAVVAVARREDPAPAIQMRLCGGDRAVGRCARALADAAAAGDRRTDLDED